MKEKLALMIRKITSIQNMPSVLGECYREIMQYVKEIRAIEPIESFVIYHNMDICLILKLISDLRCLRNFQIKDI